MKNLIAESRVGFKKAQILGFGKIETMAAFFVRAKDLGPWRSKKHLVMVTVNLSKGRKNFFACQVFEGCSSINQTPVKENPTLKCFCGCLVGKGYGNRAAQESGRILPRKSGAVSAALFLDDPPPWLFYDWVPAPSQFCKQGGFSASRATGNYDESVHVIRVFGIVLQMAGFGRRIVGGNLVVICRAQ